MKNQRYPLLMLLVPWNLSLLLVNLAFCADARSSAVQAPARKSPMKLQLKAGTTTKTKSLIDARKASPSTVRTQAGASAIVISPIVAARNLEQQTTLQKRSAILKMPAGQEQNALMKQEILRHQSELKRLSMAKAQERSTVISDLKQKWKRVDEGWQAECARHDDVIKELQKLPAGAEREAKLNAENGAHRSASKELAAQRNAVHEGVLKQANREVAGSSSAVTSAEARQTAGTGITDPNHRGMSGDFDAGGGYRTTEKIENILNEIGVKGPDGAKVKVRGGVLETAPDFGMTVNANAGADRIGSAGYQAEVKQNAAQHETYLSERGGAMQTKALKDQIAVLDHTKKALPGLNESPDHLIGDSAEAQGMAKGALKAANQSGLSPERLSEIAKHHGIEKPDQILDTLSDLKTNRAKIANVDEAARLQGVTKEILEAAQLEAKAKAETKVHELESKVSQLEASGRPAEAGQIRKEIVDYRTKLEAATEAVAAEKVPIKSAGSSAGQKTSVIAEGEAGMSLRTKVISGAGLLLGAYGIYEGYNTAKEEMDAKQKAEPSGAFGWTKEKAELAARTFWHGLGFGAMAEIGDKAGREAFEEYKKGIESGKISPDSIPDLLSMKAKAVLGGLLGAGKAVTYDTVVGAVKGVKEAGTEGQAAGGAITDMIKNWSNEKETKDRFAQAVYDKLLQKGASTVGAQRAADAVRNGDFSEAKRLDKILDSKKASQSAAQESAKSYRERKKRLEKAKKSDVASTPSSAADHSFDEQKVRSMVSARLQEIGMPALPALVENLVRVFEKEEMTGLNASIVELAQMQGQFSGKLNDKYPMTVRINGTEALGKCSLRTVESDQNQVTTQYYQASIAGNLDPISGQLILKFASTLSTTVEFPQLRQSSTNTFNSKFSSSGRWNGRGYNKPGNDWYVVRSSN